MREESTTTIEARTLVTILSKQNGKRSLDQISLDRNCHFSVDQNFTNHLIKFFDTFHLIESLNNEFDQLPKSVGSFLALVYDLARRS